MQLRAPHVLKICWCRQSITEDMHFSQISTYPYSTAWMIKKLSIIIRSYSQGVHCADCHLTTIIWISSSPSHQVYYFTKSIYFLRHWIIPNIYCSPHHWPSCQQVQGKLIKYSIIHNKHWHIFPHTFHTSYNRPLTTM